MGNIRSLPLYEGVDWNLHLLLTANIAKSLPLYEGVDWNNICRAAIEEKALRLPLYEGVDWNLFGMLLL